MLQDTNYALNKFSSSLFFLFCSFLLSACSATKNVAPFIPPAASTGEATVYVYRPDAMANAMYSPGLTVDGEFKLYIKNGVNSRLMLPPGEHVFEIQDDRNYSELKSLSLIFKAGSLYFIRVNTTLKINNDTSYQPYVRNFQLIPTDESQAVREITACCMASSKGAVKTKKATPDEKETTDGFSVDKTQNPFSH